MGDGQANPKRTRAKHQCCFSNGSQKTAGCLCLSSFLLHHLSCVAPPPVAMAPKSFKMVWAKRLPRKPTEPRVVASVERSPAESAGVQMGHRRTAERACAPQSKRRKLQGKESNGPAYAHQDGAHEEPRALAQGSSQARRLAAGRTPQRLAALMRQHLFAAPPSNLAGPLHPKAGLFAHWGESRVFIISAFARYGVPHADENLGQESLAFNEIFRHTCHVRCDRVKQWSLQSLVDRKFKKLSISFCFMIGFETNSRKMMKKTIDHVCP